MGPVWLECAIHTAPAGIEPVCACLTACGIVGLEVEEEADVLRFAAENQESWDRVDEQLLDRLRGINRVKCYFTDDEEGRARLEEVKAALARLPGRTGAELGSLELTLRPLQEEDWANNWKTYYKPFPVGKGLYIIPEWMPDEVIPEGRRGVWLNPGLIFGTGSHGTTRLCLEALEQYVCPGDRVLDLGCGSGILAIAALILGAGEAKGCDIDPKAVGVARENAGYNGIGEEFSVFCGDVLTDAALREALAGRYQVVAANIIADVIIPLTPAVGDFLARDGVFLCSGIIAHREEDVVRALEENGFSVMARWEREGWLAFAAKKKEG